MTMKLLFQLRVEKILSTVVGLVVASVGCAVVVAEDASEELEKTVWTT